MAAKNSRGNRGNGVTESALKNTSAKSRPSAARQHPAEIIQRTQGDQARMNAGDLLLLQRTIGNGAVGRLLARPTGQESPAGNGLPDMLRAGAEEQLRLINGLYPRGEPRTGDWIKVIQ